MNFKTREHIYVRHNGQEYVIRPETTGIEHNRGKQEGYCVDGGKD